MVKNFKGKVHIADVQKEFDNLVTGINTIIDAYNSSDYIQNIDYNDVSADLAPSGYTLSIGGLKKMLNAYTGCVLGCSVLRDSTTNNLVITNGLYITPNGGKAIASGTLPLSLDKKEIFYDLNNKVYSYDKINTSSKEEEIITNWQQPVLTNNNDWGTVSADTDDANGFKAFDKNDSTYWSYNNNNTLVWNFKNSLLLENITVTILNGTGNQDFARVKDITAYGIDENNSDTYIGKISFTQSQQGLLTQALPYNKAIKFKGIKFHCTSHLFYGNTYCTGRIADVAIKAREVILQQNPTTTVAELPEEWIKIADLNTNRDTAYSNTRPFWCSNIDKFDILVGNNGSSWSVQQTLDNSDKAVFVGASTPNYRTEDNNFVHLFGVPVSNFHPASKEHIGGASKPKLYLPKGVANPYQVGWGNNQFLVYPANVTKS